MTELSTFDAMSILDEQFNHFCPQICARTSIGQGQNSLSLSLLFSLAVSQQKQGTQKSRNKAVCIAWPTKLKTIHVTSYIHEFVMGLRTYKIHRKSTWLVT